MTRLNRRTASFLLLLATVFWGFAFIAQKNAMSSMGPLTFIGARYLIGGVLILPLALWEHKRAANRLTSRQWWLIFALCLNFFAGSWLQQEGLILTTATNGGFLTGLYVFFVPLILLLVFRIRPHRLVWICAPLALAGLFLLNGATLDRINQGDLLVVSSAVFWAMHVLLLGFLSRETARPIFVSCLSFLVAGAMAQAGALALEAPQWSQLQAGWLEIAYAAIFSTAIGFTLQAIGQLHVPPANAAIILSAETLFAALGAALLLGERLLPLGYLGAALIFAAVVLVEAVPHLRRARPA